MDRMQFVKLSHLHIVIVIVFSFLRGWGSITILLNKDRCAILRVMSVTSYYVILYRDPQILLPCSGPSESTREHQAKPVQYLINNLSQPSDLLSSLEMAR